MILSNSDLIDVGVVTHEVAAAQVAVVLLSLQTLPPGVGDVTEGISPAGRLAWPEFNLVIKLYLMK